MNEHDLNEIDQEDCALINRVLRRVLIHDLLPSNPGEPGMGISAIQRGLHAQGVNVDTRMLQRELKDMAELFWVEEAGYRGKAVLWKKVLDEGLAAHVRPLAAQSRQWFQNGDKRARTQLGARHPGECPDFDSDIHVDWKYNTTSDRKK